MMRYCSSCGGLLHREVPAGDERMRDVCAACGTIHYQNPKVVAGAIPEWEGKILLCRRAIEPKYGLWTLPAGFMENEETTIAAAVRETHEEAAALITVDALYGLFSLPHINQVYVMFRGHLTEPTFGPGIESLEVALFSEADIPWDTLAFPVVRETLRLYFADRQRGAFGIYTGDVIREGSAVEIRYL